MLTAETSRIELPSLEEIHHLAGLGNLKYKDMTVQPAPFFAVDDFGPHERDDAIRAIKTKSGFLIQAAIADGGGIAKTAHVLPSAIREKTNEYIGPKLAKSILPKRFVKLFELGQGVSPAIVISQKFDNYAVPVDQPDIYLAEVISTKMNYYSFGKHCKTEICNDYDQKIQFVEFTRAYRDAKNLRTKTISQDSSPRAIKEHSIRVVATFMTIANLAVAQWSQSNGVPIVYRHFPKNFIDTEDDNFAEGSPVYAKYTHDPSNLHFGLSGHPEGASYTHCSSPLRRGVDVFNHAQLHLFWQSQKHKIQPIDLGRVAQVADYMNA